MGSLREPRRGGRLRPILPRRQAPHDILPISCHCGRLAGALASSGFAREFVRIRSRHREPPFHGFGQQQSKNLEGSTGDGLLYLKEGLCIPQDRTMSTQDSTCRSGQRVECAFSTALRGGEWHASDWLWRSSLQRQSSRPDRHKPRLTPTTSCMRLGGRRLGDGRPGQPLRH